jgi:hypothetical protein
MHVHKTGGAALTGVLANRFAARDCLELYAGLEPDLSQIDRYRYVGARPALPRALREPLYILTVRDPIDRALTYARSFPAEYRRPRSCEWAGSRVTTRGHGGGWPGMHAG